jgi:hypothetical protein
LDLAVCVSDKGANRIASGLIGRLNSVKIGPLLFRYGVDPPWPLAGLGPEGLIAAIPFLLAEVKVRCEAAADPGAKGPNRACTGPSRTAGDPGRDDRSTVSGRRTYS